MAKAGMGIDIADDRNNGHPTVVMSNFSGEMVGLYRDNGTGFFEEQSVESGVGGPSEQLLGFGAVFFSDYNNDGWQDLFVANGHVQDQIQQFSEGVEYREPPLPVSQPGRRQVPRSGAAGRRGDAEGSGYPRGGIRAMSTTMDASTSS